METSRHFPIGSNFVGVIFSYRWATAVKAQTKANRSPNKHRQNRQANSSRKQCVKTI